jgi:hypothetical protein
MFSAGDFIVVLSLPGFDAPLSAAASGTHPARVEPVGIVYTHRGFDCKHAYQRVELKQIVELA